MNSTILAIETATSSCSVALKSQGEIYQQRQLGNNIHSTLLLEMVHQVLGQASIAPEDLSVIAVGQGPGSFTGLRIGIGVAQGLAYGADCPMIGISSLDALAQQSTNDGTVLAAIDARMGEVYYCEYVKTGSKLERVGELKVCKPELVVLSDRVKDQLSLVGNAWSEYWNKFDHQLVSAAVQLEGIIYPGATALLELAEGRMNARDLIAAADFKPEYVRNDVAKKASTGKA